MLMRVRSAPLTSAMSNEIKAAMANNLMSAFDESVLDPEELCTRAMWGVIKIASIDWQDT